MVHVFIINQFAGNRILSREIRHHLASKHKLKYFLFNTVNAGFEKEITKKVIRYFEDEKLRIYCCGGSGTMRNIIDSIDDLSKVEVAFFPCGLTNDFLKVFDKEELFRDIDKLIYGKVIKADYIKTNYGIALNTLSVGYDSNIENAMRKYRIYDAFHPMIPYVMSVIKGIVFARAREFEITLDGVKSSKKYSEIVFGNGAVLGGNLFFSERTNIQDGEASYLTVQQINTFEATSILSAVMNKKLRSIKKKVRFGSCRNIEIRSKDGKPIQINFDGELIDCGEEVVAEIVEMGLNLVIPKEIELKDYILQ